VQIILPIRIVHVHRWLPSRRVPVLHRVLRKVSLGVTHLGEPAKHESAVGVSRIKLARRKHVGLVICRAAKVLGDTVDLSDTDA
jgi:hypothetical protein